MDKDTKFALLVIGVPILGLVYCAFMIGFLLLVPWGQNHPIITAAIFVLTPSIVSGSIWLISSARAKNKEKLGL